MSWFLLKMLMSQRQRQKQTQKEAEEEEAKGAGLMMPAQELTLTHLQRP
jgi:hypothetical protein